MWVRRYGRRLVLVAGTALAFVAGGGGIGADLVASAPAWGPVRGGRVAAPFMVDRAVAEVTAALVDAGRPPCGNVTVAVAPTPDGRSWSWPGRCQILLDSNLVGAGGGEFRYVVRHELAHLHRGTDHFDPGFRALETRLAGDIGYDLIYSPGEEYPQVVERRPPTG
jgi:hypothetical protein